MVKAYWLQAGCLFSVLLNIGLFWLVINLLKFDTTRVDLYDYMVNHYGQIEVVLTGDSLTRRNSDLAWQAGGLALNVKNIAKDGDNVLQVASQVQKAIAKRPRFIIVMAGTNRIQGMSARETFLHYQDLLAEITRNGITPIILFSPLTNRPELNNYLRELNALLSEHATLNNLITFDVNNTLGIEHQLNRPYTEDGVHLTSIGYERLNAKLIPFIKSHLRKQNNKN